MWRTRGRTATVRESAMRRGLNATTDNALSRGHLHRSLGIENPDAHAWLATIPDTSADEHAEGDLGKRGWPELCPVVYALPGGWLVVMQRATPLGDEQAKSFDPLAILSRDEIPAAPKGCSVGMIDG